MSTSILLGLYCFSLSVLAQDSDTALGATSMSMGARLWSMIPPVNYVTLFTVFIGLAIPMVMWQGMGSLVRVPRQHTVPKATEKLLSLQEYVDKATEAELLAQNYVSQEKHDYAIQMYALAGWNHHRAVEMHELAENYEAAIAQSVLATKAYHKSNDHENVRAVLRKSSVLACKLATKYITEGEHDRAIIHYRLAASLYLSLGDYLEASAVYSGLAMLYSSLGDSSKKQKATDLATKWYQEAATTTFNVKVPVKEYDDLD